MDESLNARRVRLSLSVNGHDVTDHVKPDLLDFSFVDNAKGKADEISFTLKDSTGKWSNEWKIKKGMAVIASLTCYDWLEQGKHLTLPMGGFTVDEVELSGPPDKITVKAVSAAKTGNLSEEAKTDGWENFDLEGLAQEIADEHELELMYEAPAHQFTRVDQREESDLAFLNRLCEERGVNLKVHDGQMILMDARSGDAQKPSLTIPKKDSHLSPVSYSFKESQAGTFKDAEVDYHDPEANENYFAEVEHEGEPVSGQTLILNDRVESASEAIAYGSAALRSKNEKASTANIEIMGWPGLVAGITVSLTGWGSYDGAYFVEKAEHKVGPAYTTSADLRRTLSY